MEQTIAGVQRPQAALIEVPDDGLEERLACLEATVAELQEALRELLAPSSRRAFRSFGRVYTERSPGARGRPFGEPQDRDGGYSWVELPAHLKDVTDYSQLEPEELVYIHELTDDDVRRRLEELEQWYGMSSEEFYRRWRRGEADDVFEKIEWSALYEDRERIEAEASSLNEGTE